MFHKIFKHTAIWRIMSWDWRLGMDLWSFFYCYFYPWSSLERL